MLALRSKSKLVEFETIGRGGCLQLRFTSRLRALPLLGTGRKCFSVLWLIPCHALSKLCDLLWLYEADGYFVSSLLMLQYS